MKCFQDIYEAIAKEGFIESTLHAINELVNQIENGSTDLPRFNLREHSGVCKAGSALIGASIVASYAERSLATSSHAGSGQGSPSNWEIDKLVAEKGFRDNREGQGVNYISDRIALEDMHPANVFIDEVTSLPICIDCIVKFVKK